jgi:hypothetical protein
MPAPAVGEKNSPLWELGIFEEILLWRWFVLSFSIDIAEP